MLQAHPHIHCVNAVDLPTLRKMQKDEKKTRTIRLLIKQLQAMRLPLPMREQTDLVPGRDFRVDLCWLDARLCVEYEGGTFTHQRTIDKETGRKARSRHLTPMGFHDDCDKYNALQMEGFAVLRFDVKHVESGEAAATIATAYYTRRTHFEQEAEALLERAVAFYGAQEIMHRLHVFAFSAPEWEPGA